jgi:hypothetical protein
MIPLDLKEIEKKVFRTFFDDGLLELGIGCAVFLSGLSMTIRGRGAIYALFVIPVLALVWMKRAIVVPRAGLVIAGIKHKKKRLKAAAVLFVSLMINLLIIVGARKGIFHSFSGDLPVISILISLKILIVLILLGIFLGYDRLYYWAGVLATGFMLSEGRIHETGKISDGGVMLMITGGLVFAAGWLLFICFIHKYPLPAEENHG